MLLCMGAVPFAGSRTRRAMGLSGHRELLNEAGTRKWHVGEGPVRSCWATPARGADRARSCRVAVVGVLGFGQEAVDPDEFQNPANAWVYPAHPGSAAHGSDSADGAHQHARSEGVNVVDSTEIEDQLEVRPNDCGDLVP